MTTQLTQQQLGELARELDAIRAEAMSQVGERDAQHIRKILRLQRLTEIGGRGLLFLGFNPAAWLAGSSLLGVSKILDNMEIGHNVMHGQYDWMNDPRLHSNSFEWDTACDSDSWRRTHNYEHHTYTNVLGLDRDYGYGVLRLTHEDEFQPQHRFQFFSYLMLSTFFQWGVSLHEMEADRIYKGEVKLSEKKPLMKAIAKKGGRQIFKDYVFFPLLTGPLFFHTLAGNATANLMRNWWTSTIIFCGHFPEGVETFDKSVCDNESRGHWYYRQMLGSANFRGSRWLHIMSGHLSYQIEHHLFPDVPSHRYVEMSPKVEAVAKKFGIPYNSGSFGRQYATVLKRIIKHSRPAPRKLAAA